MRQKLILLVLLLMTGSLVTEVTAQSLVIQAKDGTDTVRNLSILQKLTFGNSNLLMNYTSGSSETYALTNISRIYFKSGTTAAEAISRNQNEGKITLYPNPVENTLHLLNVPQGILIVRIYRIDGAMIMQTQVSPGNYVINVSNLNSGLYLIQIQDQALKFNKL